MIFAVLVLAVDFDSIAALMGGGAALLTVIVTLVSLVVTTIRNGRKTAAVGAQVEEVHVLVNSRLDETLAEARKQSARSEQLYDLLRASGIAIPSPPPTPPAPGEGP